MSVEPTKSRLQASALKLIVAKGVKATTTRDLAESAGVAEGTIYRHYPSKDDLVRDLFNAHYDAFSSALLQVSTTTPGGIGEKLTAMVEHMCALYDRDPTLYRFLLLVQHEALPHISETHRGPISILTDMIRTAITRGDIPDQNADLAAAMILGAVAQSALASIYGTLHGPLAELAPAIASGCKRILESTEGRLSLPEITDQCIGGP